jgi:hypothetical protein
MKLRGSSARNSPERSRSAETTPEMSRPACVSLAAPPRKAGIAIGIGSTLPLVMSMRNSARTDALYGSIISAAKTAPAKIRQLLFIRCPLG